MAYTPRLTAPSASDPRWIMDDYGGYNLCIAGSNGPPSVLPNCTGYVHGRVMEIRGVNTDDSGLSFGNGVDYYTGSSAAWIQESEPSLGAVACYGTTGGVGGWPGHVAIVEQIIDSDTIVVSESDYGGTYFRTLTCYRQHNWRYPGATDVYPLGFLKNPYVDGGGQLTKSVLILLLAKFKERSKLYGRIIKRV